MTLQTGKDAMISHPLSSVYGSYCVTVDDAPIFVTADPKMLFQTLESLDYAGAAKVRILLVSSEDWSAPDDLTAFVWEAMAEHYAGTTNIADDWDQWCEITGHDDLGFIQFGYDEFNPNQERAKRKAADQARMARIARCSPSPIFLQAAE